MKLLLVLVLLSGCASTMTDYNRGCRDGIRSLSDVPQIVVLESETNAWCDKLDSLDRIDRTSRDRKP